ncbi:8115_t:CDS:1 [Ambispora gerdemannii]|uniref:8115_t:CDS:1 n=1 Tax=Ambispora gerdemannii TaxID=144530 RepID=A0A9N8UVP4_9GLOM|nr:8115_t:CDS:1 [Ambispora gerdemannii]
MSNSAALFFYGYELSSYSLKVRNKLLVNFEKILSESRFSRNLTPEPINEEQHDDDLQFDNESALSIHTPVGLHCPLVELLASTDNEKNGAVPNEENGPSLRQDPHDYNADLYQEKKELIGRFHSDLSNPNLRKRLDEIQLEILERRESKVKNLVQDRFNEILDELNNELKEKNKSKNPEKSSDSAEPSDKDKIIVDTSINENRKRAHENDDDAIVFRAQQNKKQRVQECLSVTNKTDCLRKPRSSFHEPLPEIRKSVRDDKIATGLDIESYTPPGSPIKETAQSSQDSEPKQSTQLLADNSNETNDTVTIEQSPNVPIKKYYNSPMGLYRDEYGMDIRIPYFYHFRYLHHEIPYILDRSFMTRIELLASKRDAEIQHFFSECGVKVDGLKAKWVVTSCEF